MIRGCIYIYGDTYEDQSNQDWYENYTPVIYPLDIVGTIDLVDIVTTIDIHYYDKVSIEDSASEQVPST